MRKYAYPWDLRNFHRSYSLKSHIWGKLFDLGFSIKSLKEEPTKQVVNSTRLVLDKLFALKKKGVPPWIFIVCKDKVLMQALAETVPATYSFTTIGSCFKVDTLKLTDLYSARLPRSDFEEDPAGETIHSINNAGLLFWADICVGTNRTVGHSGRYFHVLKDRLIHKRFTVFTSGRKFASLGTGMDEIISSISKELGENVAPFIEDYAVVLKIKSKEYTPEVMEVQI